ncbi:MAG TPA: SH3 domain-containing protein, partial [Pirellulales bacterium]|nr:SH3 domain-containing protein [Pirellulales bacterium]
MRPMYIIGAAIAALALVGTLVWTRFAPAQTQTPSTSMVGEKEITVADVDVRSGPSDKFYVTGKLKSGDKVQLVVGKTNPGWLAIKPPDGSMSLVEAPFVKIMSSKANGVIDVSPNSVPVRPAPPGGQFVGQIVDVESTELPAGSQVIIVRDATYDPYTKKTWYTIQPPDRDVRYIPESAVARPNAIQQTGAQVPSGFVAPPGSPPLLSQADRQLDQAKEFYRLAAQSSDASESRTA